jgi:hypothetical protein
MTDVNALDQFGMDLSDATATTSFAERLPDCADSRLVLNLSGCILDYPATSMLINGALNRLAQSPAPRLLVIQFDIRFQERVFEKWLFFGSDLLDRNYQTLAPLALRDRVNEMLRSLEVSIRIAVVDASANNSVLEYKYG